MHVSKNRWLSFAVGSAVVAVAVLYCAGTTLAWAGPRPGAIGQFPVNAASSALAPASAVDLQSAVRSSLDRLVTAGQISPSQADAIFAAQRNGSLDLGALVVDGTITGAQARVVGDALDGVKRSATPVGTFAPEVPLPTKPAPPYSTQAPNIPAPDKPAAAGSTPAPLESAPSKS